MSHRPRKRFGQNFLQNQAIIENILRAVHLQKTDRVIEIGPGLGALTKPMLQILSALIVIEIDTDLQALLNEMPGVETKLVITPEHNTSLRDDLLNNPQLTIIGGDALSIDYSQFGRNLRLIGNLPYNISTPLLLQLLHFSPYITDMHFMLQKEVVERIAAQPGNKTYGRLSVMCQYFCEVEQVLDVPPEAFYPQPKVESAVVRLTPLRPSPYPAIRFADLERLVAQAFSMRRKTLANNLKPLISAADIHALGIDPTRRPEQLSVIEYVQLAKFISK